MDKNLTLSRRIFFSSVGISFVLSVILFFAGLRDIPPQPVWQGTPAFNAKNAYEWTRKLAKGFPNRVAWREERKHAAEYLKEEFFKMGYAVSTVPFSEDIGHRHVDGLENIFVTLPGRELRDEYIVVLAHYDITDTTVEGAADDASGIGTVLELARIFKKEAMLPRRSIIFLLTDSEEFGAFWGAHNFIEKYPNASKIVAAVSLDFVAPDQQQDILVLTDGLKSGYTPLWFRELALASIRSVPYPADDTKNVLEFVQRAILVPPSDHGAFLGAGIPALNFFGRSTDFAHEMGAIHHTPNDNMEHLRLESFVPYGKGAETLLRSLDALPPMADDPELRSMRYWKLTDKTFLTGETFTAIHFLCFLPFFVYIGLLVRNLSVRESLRRKRILRVLRSETKSFLAVLGSLLAGYVLLRYLPDLKIIEKYEMFPATQKSVILNHPAYLAILLVLAVIGALYFILRKTLGARDPSPQKAVDLQTRHCLLGIILAGVAALALWKNSTLGALVLLPPSYLWMFMKNTRRLESRMVNALLFLGGLVSFIAICIVITLYFHLGVFYWYLFLAMSYGLISVYATILALAVVTVGIRILRNLIL